jgi:subtilase family serine protease
LNVTATNTTLTMSGIPSENGTFSYTVTAIAANETARMNGTITVVEPELTLNVTAGAANQTVKIGKGITETRFTTSKEANFTFWGVPKGLIRTVTSVMLTISGTPAVAGEFNYTVTATRGSERMSAHGEITVIGKRGGTHPSTKDFPWNTTVYIGIGVIAVVAIIIVVVIGVMWYVHRRRQTRLNPSINNPGTECEPRKRHTKHRTTRYPRNRI